MGIAPRAFGSYEELLASKDIDAVYIPLPTGLRKEWVLRAAGAGKHILSEKPCAVSSDDLREMLDTCRQHHVQFMDGVMFMHSGRMQRMREVLDDPKAVGGIRRIQSAFTFCAPPEFYAGNIRSQSSLEPHGCMGDLGWYCIRFSLWAMKWQMPQWVSARMLSGFSANGDGRVVPTELSTELFFNDGVSAGFYCSFRTENQEWAMISGDKGYLRLDDFVLPLAGREVGFEVQQVKYQVNGCDVRMTVTPHRYFVNEPSHGEAGAQESNLFRAFSEQVQSGVFNIEWPESALQTQVVLNACLESARDDGRAVSLRGIIG